MPGLHDSAILKEPLEGMTAGTRCVLVDDLDGQGGWLVECFDAPGETLDVIAVDGAALEPVNLTTGDPLQPVA
jgi:hypothetical protein